MNAAVWGLLSSASLGAADFMGRFSARTFGAPLAYALVLLVGSITTSVWMAVTGTAIVWDAWGWFLAILHGVSVAVMCMLLYAGLARGPVAIVAPIVAAHPALVLVVNVLMGVRPSALQWAAMVATILGGILIARSAESHPQFADEGRKELRTTIAIAVGASLAYVPIVFAGQGALHVVGDLQTAWIGRWTGLLFVGLVLLVRRPSSGLPAAWLPFFGLQGILDSLGYITLLAGIKTSAPHIAVVVASTFSVVTVFLARVVLKEPISLQQWGAIALIAAGTAVLAHSA